MPAFSEWMVGFPSPFAPTTLQQRDYESGAITVWQGITSNIPSGWVLCNGKRGTPDLRDKFSIGAASSYPPGATGGTADHVHTFTSDGHDHPIVFPQPPNINGAFEFSDRTDTVQSTGTTDPPGVDLIYYSLAYIMHL